MNRLWSDPLILGKFTLKNRIMLAAMTRARCDPETGVPNDLHVKYYGQRSGAGLCLTQASSWSPRGCSFPGAANIYTKEHAQGWKKVTTEVHKNGGKIFLQLFHGGRATHPKLNGGHQPWAPSALPIKHDKITMLKNAEYPTPKQMTIQEIQLTKKEFQQSLKLAKAAEFDGIQLHGANGYLIDQFLRSNSNKRTDGYGGDAEKRCRFTLELAQLASKHFQSYQIGVKVCPIGRYNDMFDENPIETYSHLLKQLDSLSIGFVQLTQSVDRQLGTKCFDKYILPKDQIKDVSKTLRPFFKGLIINNNGLDAESGLKKIREGSCDGVSFGKLYISNPDLAERIIKGNPLNKSINVATFYGVNLQNKAKGYTDYPLYQA